MDESGNYRDGNNGDEDEGNGKFGDEDCRVGTEGDELIQPSTSDAVYAVVSKKNKLNKSEAGNSSNGDFDEEQADVYTLVDKKKEQNDNEVV